MEHLTNKPSSTHVFSGDTQSRPAHVEVPLLLWFASHLLHGQTEGWLGLHCALQLCDPALLMEGEWT